jgi:hypothetical protein
MDGRRRIVFYTKGECRWFPGPVWRPPVLTKSFLRHTHGAVVGSGSTGLRRIARPYAAKPDYWDCRNGSNVTRPKRCIRSGFLPPDEECNAWFQGFAAAPLPLAGQDL